MWWYLPCMHPKLQSHVILGLPEITSLYSATLKWFFCYAFELLNPIVNCQHLQLPARKEFLRLTITVNISVLCFVSHKLQARLSIFYENRILEEKVRTSLRPIVPLLPLSILVYLVAPHKDIIPNLCFFFLMFADLFQFCYTLSKGTTYKMEWTIDFHCNLHSVLVSFFSWVIPDIIFAFFPAD